MLDTLGVMLKHNNNLNQNDIINKQDARAALIEARRKRIEEARQEMVREEEKINQEIIDRNNDRDKDNGDGFVGRVLSMSTGTSLFMSSLTAIVEGMDKAGVSSMEEAEASLKRIDKSAKDEDIEDLLKLLSEKVVAFDQLMLDRNIENYESNIRLEEERIAQEQEKESLEKSISLNLLDEINGITFYKHKLKVYVFISQNILYKLFFKLIYCIIL